MHDWESQSYVKWDCKYPIVIVPKYRRQAIYGSLRAKVGRILRELCDQMGVNCSKDVHCPIMSIGV
jgi:putative transposase